MDELWMNDNYVTSKNNCLRSASDLSANLLANVVDFIPDAVLAIDLEGRVITWNKALEEMTGLSAEEMLGRGNYEYAIPFYGFRRPILIDLVTKPDQRFSDEYKNLQRSGDTLIGEIFIPSFGVNGSYLWGKAAPLCDSDGNVVGAVESIRNITERRLKDNALKESEAKFKGIYESSPIGVEIYGPDGRLIHANRACLDIFGVTDVEDVAGFSLFGDPNIPDDARESLLKGDVVRYETAFDFEKVNYFGLYRTSRSGIAQIYAIISPLYLEGSNIPSSYLVQVQDITGRKHMENALRESERRLANIINFLPDATMVIDKEGKVIAWNHAIEAMTGVKSKDMLGRGKYEYALPFYGIRRPILIDFVLGSWPELETSYFNLIKGDRILVGEAYMPMLDGGKAYLWCVASALYDSGGNIVGAIESIRDITEKKRYEDALNASLQEREVLIKEVHHRVKNNLQIVSSLLRLQSMDLQDKEVLRVLEDSQSRIKSMALVHERLYRSGDLSKVPITEYISKLTSDLVRAFGYERRVRVYVDLDEASLEIDKAIPFGLILNELITNCLRHAFPGDRNGEVHVELGLCGNRLELTVGDNGVGIPDDVDIYRPKSTGMVLVQSLVKQLKGTLEIKVEGGTRFRICIGI